MARKGLIINTDDCVGCLACEVACKQEHDTPVGVGRIRVHREDPAMIEGRLRLRYNVAYCLHCLNPLCHEACPNSAIIKREDGIVLIDNEACIGCAACVDACPLGMIQFDNEKGVALKCDLCINRTDRGLPPACASACISHCIHFGDIDEMIHKSPELSPFLRDIKSADRIQGRH